MAKRCHPRQCTLMIYLWKGSGIVSCFQTICMFRQLTVGIFICCTGLGLLVQGQKMAETVLDDLTIPEIHWHWVVPVYLPLEVFIFGKGSGMVSCLANV